MVALSRRSALCIFAAVGLTACSSTRQTANQAATSSQSSATGASSSASASASSNHRVETGVRTDSGYHLNTVVEGAPTVTLYTDHQCPYCAEADPTYREVAGLLEGKMNVTVRHFPLPRHTNAVPAAQAVQAAEKQGAHMAMSEKIFAHQADWKSVTDADQLKQIFTGYAEELKLDTNQFVADLPNADSLKLIQDEFAAGEAAGVPGTPTFIVDGALVETADSSSSAEDMAAAFTKQAGL